MKDVLRVRGRTAGWCDGGGAGRALQRLAVKVATVSVSCLVWGHLPAAAPPVLSLCSLRPHSYIPMMLSSFLYSYDVAVASLPSLLSYSDVCLIDKLGRRKVRVEGSPRRYV